MGDMDAKEARLTILAGIRIKEDEIIQAEEKDPAVESAEDKLRYYVCYARQLRGGGGSSHLGKGAAGSDNGPSHERVGRKAFRRRGMRWGTH